MASAVVAKEKRKVPKGSGKVGEGEYNFGFSDIIKTMEEPLRMLTEMFGYNIPIFSAGIYVKGSGMEEREAVLVGQCRGEIEASGTQTPTSAILLPSQRFWYSSQNLCRTYTSFRSTSGRSLDTSFLNLPLLPSDNFHNTNSSCWPTVSLLALRVTVHNPRRRRRRIALY